MSENRIFKNNYHRFYLSFNFFISVFKKKYFQKVSCSKNVFTDGDYINFLQDAIASLNENLQSHLFID